MKLEHRRRQRRLWTVFSAALVLIAGCGSGPAKGLEPVLLQPHPLVRYATTAELRQAIAAHIDKSHTARTEITDLTNDLPQRVGVVQWRPAYAHDISSHRPATATTKEKDERIIWIGDDIYTFGGDIEPSGKPWKKEKAPAGTVDDPLPSEQEDFDSVIEGVQIRGQAVLGYKFDYEEYGHQTYFMNAQNQLVQLEERSFGLELNYTYYDFGVSVNVVAPPPDQVEPA
jgi:hypothetical protein